MTKEEATTPNKLVTLAQARQLVKSELRRQGIKLSHVLAIDITKAAKEVMRVENEQVSRQSRR